MRWREDPTSPKTSRRAFLSMGVGALAVLGLPAALRGRRGLVRRKIPVMGTVAEIAIPTRHERWAQGAIDAAFGELRRVDVTMSRFRADSDVGRLDRGGGRWLRIGHDTAVVLREALAWAKLTEGRFDPCLAELARLWDVAHRRTPPAADRVRAVAGLSLWTALEVEVRDGGGRARLEPGLASVDLGGIAKGFGVDAAADALRSFGVTDGLVNVGGDLVALGADASGDPWRIGVRAPDAPDGLAATLEVTDAAVATSGDYLRYFEHGGRRYHHLLDPLSGGPRRTARRSLTVEAGRCVSADAAATALFCGRDGEERIDGMPSDVRLIHHITEVTT